MLAGRDGRLTAHARVGVSPAPKLTEGVERGMWVVHANGAVCLSVLAAAHVPQAFVVLGALA
jgi:hypothetical protein